MRRSTNVALLGVAAAILDIGDRIWEKAIAAEMKPMVALEEGLKAKLTNVLGALGLRPRLKLVEPRTIERSTGKAKRVVDLRDKV